MIQHPEKHQAASAIVHAQQAHRERFKEAVAYAQCVLADPGIRPIYEQMAAQKKKNNRPFDMAVSDYFQGNDLLLKRFLDNQKRP